MTFAGTVELPDGRKVFAKQDGYHETDTNAFIEESVEMHWVDDGNDGSRNGEPLTDEELNEWPIDGDYLHNYVTDRLEYLSP